LAACAIPCVAANHEGGKRPKGRGKRGKEEEKKRKDSPVLDSIVKRYVIIFDPRMKMTEIYIQNKG